MSGLIVKSAQDRLTGEKHFNSSACRSHGPGTSLSRSGEQNRSWLMELRHKSALKILGTERKLVCPKRSEDEEDQEERRLEMLTSLDQSGQCRS